MEEMEQKVSELEKKFYVHEKVNEERWKTIFKEVSTIKDDVKELKEDLKITTKYINRLLLSIAGGVIGYLAYLVVTLL